MTQDKDNALLPDEIWAYHDGFDVCLAPCEPTKHNVFLYVKYTRANVPKPEAVVKGWGCTRGIQGCKCSTSGGGAGEKPECETARNLLPAPVVPDGWLPIESAPKDKWLLLGYFNGLGKWRTVRGNWFDDGELCDIHEEEVDGRAGWYETADNAEELPNVWPINLTHWMPLPAAPDKRADGGGE